MSGKMLAGDDLEALIDASLDLWLTAGRFNELFEKKFAETVDAAYSLSVNSGSSANLLAISALTSPNLGVRRLSPGDEVITVAASFPTTVNPIVQNGLIPVFVDCELSTYNIDITQIEESITNRTKAVIAAHTLGIPFAVEQIRKICDLHDMWLVEDCCDSLGAEIDNKKVGSASHIS
ncbi:MAG: DegT/DnrJ/EryC1/StrS family aminotransferase, partial [Planctomycetota bacterium]|nr:DegT/DnrJ/EryC1/StrS family aminotransferase [Planctomycetota bacterium]